MIVRYLYRFLTVLCMTIAIVLLYWVWSFLHRPATLPFHHIKFFYPARHIDDQKIRQLTWNYIDGGFFSLHIKHLREILLNQPWIIDVSIRRQWPDTLVLLIQEKEPEARWGLEGVLSSKGDVFYPSLPSIPNDLPVIFANLEQKEDVLFKFHQFQAALQYLDLHIQKLIVSPQFVYQLTLSNGICIMMGSYEVVERFQRFIKLYPQIVASKDRDISRVDLRYAHGFAVKWKKRRLSKK